MPRRLFRKLALSGERVAQDPSIVRVFGALLTNPNLWHLNRYSVSWAVSVGLFMAFVPAPFQMLLAAGAAVIVGCNLPIAVVMVWVSNPVTMAPMYYASYKLGAWLLSVAPREIAFQMSWQWLKTQLADVWQPLLLGCFIAGVTAALIGHGLVRLIWRLRVAQSWRQRQRRLSGR